MFYLKRSVCGLCGLLIIMLGSYLLYNFTILWQIVGVFILSFGFALFHIAIKQSLPPLKIWLIFLLCCLLYAVYLVKEHNFSNSIEKKIITKKLDKEFARAKLANSPKSKEIENREEIEKNKKENDEPQTVANVDNPLLKYPKISGSTKIINASLFFIAGRYVKLYGTDAPDSDQICSDSFGAAYNCGQESVDWMKSWIDDNVIDCYLVTVNNNGYDLGICLWGEYDLGAALVKVGWAIANKNETTTYIPYENEAKSTKQGMWQGNFYPPSEWRKMKQVKQKSGGFNFGSWL